MPISGQVTTAMREAICAAFSPAEFAELVRLTLDEQLYNLVNTNAPHPQVVFDLIGVVDRQGRVEDLIAAVYKARSRVDLVVQFCQTHFPYLMSPVAAEAAQSAQNALGLVVDLAQQQKIDLSVSLGAEQASLHQIVTGIDLLDKFKQLHESLHIIDQHIYRVLLNAAVAFRKKPAGDAELLELNVVTENLAEQVQNLRETVNQLPTMERRVPEGWVEKLELAVKHLQTIVKDAQGDPEPPVRVIVRSVLGQLPAQVHNKLFDEARRLPLGTAIAALERLYDSPELKQAAVGATAIGGANGGGGAGATNANSDSLAAGLVGLRQLHALLREMVAEHNFWQKIDNDLRLMSNVLDLTMPATDTGMYELNTVAPTVVADVVAFCDLRPNENWVQAVRESATDLKAALDSQDRRKCFLTFDAFLRRSRGRFFDVDTNVRSLCGNLVSINGPFGKLAHAVGGN